MSTSTSARQNGVSVFPVVDEAVAARAIRIYAGPASSSLGARARGVFAVLHFRRGASGSSRARRPAVCGADAAEKVGRVGPTTDGRRVRSLAGVSRIMERRRRRRRRQRDRGGTANYRLHRIRDYVWSPRRRSGSSRPITRRLILLLPACFCVINATEWRETRRTDGRTATPCVQFSTWLSAGPTTEGLSCGWPE